MLTATTRSDGLLAVPGNRWDLVTATPDPAEVSVVIPYFEGQAALDLILAGLTAQTHPRSRLQVVIADDGSAEPPRTGAGAGLDVVVVRQDDRGFRAAAARNLGVRHADGRVLVLLDGDTVPEPGYVAAMSRLPTALPDAVVGGRRRYAALDGWSPGRVLRWFAGGPAPAALEEPEWLLREYRASGDLLDIGPRSYQHLIGAVLACSRELFDDIDGFDDSFVGYGGEDYDFTYRAHTAGAVFAYVPDAVAWHHGPDWSGRNPDPEAQRTQKNREIQELARRIPEPSLRGRGQVYPVPDVVVIADVTGWPFGAAVVALRSLLTAGDVGIWLAGAAAAVGAVADWFAGDPRVHVGAPPTRVTDRARVQLTVTAPVRAADGIADVLRRLTDDGVGRITAGPVTLTATRALRRAARSGVPLGGLFPDLTMTGEEAGLTPVDGEPLLSAVFGGWA
ncbi:glycosyltransferase [Nakamurella deserti]|uniref:glycosyltransferase n=1 Tax=Nakamurella deserti TaxID=2164074 RepID=UPI000DBE21B0|nr:glycosyltransferase [Nakamurella deserti]